MCRPDCLRCLLHCCLLLRLAVQQALRLQRQRLQSLQLLAGALLRFSSAVACCSGRCSSTMGGSSMRKGKVVQ
jgi:hypothetical protein